VARDLERAFSHPVAQSIMVQMPARHVEALAERDDERRDERHEPQAVVHFIASVPASITE
jgi:hypothetical protein